MQHGSAGLLHRTELNSQSTTWWAINCAWGSNEGKVGEYGQGCREKQGVSEKVWRTWMAAILRSWSWPRGSNVTTSSRRLRNSGRKCCLTTPMTRSLASAVLPCSSSRSLPRLEVRMITVLANETVRPLASVSRPSSSTPSRIFITCTRPNTE